MHNFEIVPADIETIDPALADSTWPPRFRTQITDSREEAIRMDDNDRTAIQVYTDGSGKDGKIGAAAVLYRNGCKKASLRYLLGPADRHTVPKAEGTALILGLELIRQERRVTTVSMIADNLGSIQRSTTARATPTQYLWEIFRKRWEMTKKRHKDMTMTIRWIPGHEGVTGNEEADRVAKLATEKGSSRRRCLPAPLRKPLPRSKQATARLTLATLNNRAMTTWKTSPRYGRYKDIDKLMPSKKYLQLVEGLPRRKASLLIQLRSGHIPLLSHLHRIHRADSPICAQCHGGAETVLHYIMICPAYTAQRVLLRREGGRHAMSIGKLLSDAKLLPHLFRFIGRTGRFQETFGELGEEQTDGAME
jgi:ribonuclease HI